MVGPAGGQAAGIGECRFVHGDLRPRREGPPRIAPKGRGGAGAGPASGSRMQGGLPVPLPPVYPEEVAPRGAWGLMETKAVLPAGSSQASGWREGQGHHKAV